MSLAIDPIKPRILIVEDSYLTADVLGDVVRGCGFELAGTTASLAGGLRAVEQDCLDGAVLDIDLGGRPSFPICRALRARGIPFVFVSGYSPGTIVPDEFRDTPHIGKPVDPRRLESTLHDLFDLDQASAAFGNGVLDSLPAAERAALQGALEMVTLRTGDALEIAGAPIDHVYFPVEALISMLAGISRQTRIEAASIGREGMTAPGLLLGDRTAFGETVVQAGGRAWRIAAADLSRVAECNPVLRRHLLSHVGLALREIVETSMFHGRATIIERLARWLVQTSRRLNSTRLVFTHDALARLLGVRRPSVSVGLQILEGKRLLRSTRRAIVLLDTDGLIDLAGLDRK
ncbi:MAG: helix-turn-helix domain-containing protein [Reyranella sp.]|uniref:helix-turn-helix domain-containing protein n=1 Tax=Reyranella sp. TaxID=1929291 RepID=UPI003D0C5E64